jgi:hypothetical protein
MAGPYSGDSGPADVLFSQSNLHDMLGNTKLVNQLIGIA